jgi:hypothetical protein
MIYAAGFGFVGAFTCRMQNRSGVPGSGIAFSPMGEWQMGEGKISFPQKLTLT